MKLLVVVGTRPEAIKMAPVILALRREPAVETRVCVTGQHREMLAPVLSLFGIVPECDLKLMDADQSLNRLAAKAIAALDAELEAAAPDRVLVHGDTSTAMAAALAAFHRGIGVAHVEAGLRTYDPARPWPEELNRRAIDLVSDILFAPTERARRNLEGERLQGRILVTGNSGIDALHGVSARLQSEPALREAADAALPPLDPARKLVVVTGHRRESFGTGLAGICAALARLARRDDVEIAWPVHLNPKVRGPVAAALGETPNVRLLPPLSYLPFVRLMQRAAFILTDSGGIQEEAPSLGKPVLVMRDVTERPEAVEAGTARLVGTDPDAIVVAAAELLDDGARRDAAGAVANPYGDGHASARIVDALIGREVRAFRPG